MSKTIRITYFGVEGEGATVKEAKLAAGRKIEEHVKALDDQPVIVRVGEWSALVAYTANGWGYRIIDCPDHSYEPGPVFLNYGEPDKHEIRKRALRHLIDCAWAFPENDEAFIDGIFASRNGAPLNHTERAIM